MWPFNKRKSAKLPDNQPFFSSEEEKLHYENMEWLRGAKIWPSLTPDVFVNRGRTCDCKSAPRRLYARVQDGKRYEAFQCPECLEGWDGDGSPPKKGIQNPALIDQRIARIKGHGEAKFDHPDVVTFDPTPTHLLGKDIMGRTILVVPLADVSVALIEKVAK